MFSTSFALRPLAAAALFAVAGAANAAITVVTSLPAFTALTTAPGTDTYTGFSITGTTPSPITRTAGAYTYVAAVSTTTFFGAGTTANPWLSTNTATDSITFNGFSPSVGAIGGNFFGSNVSGLFQAGNVTLTATDSFNATSTFTITGAAVTSFAGFVSNGTITSLVLTSVQPSTGFLWPTTDNLVLARVNPIPEPETYALMLAGMGMLGWVARRRRG